jgi:hypothetical protein
MEYPMKVYGLNVFEWFLMDTVTILGWALLALGICVATLPRAFGFGPLDRAILATASAMVAFPLHIAGAGIRQNRATLELACLLLAVLGLGWTVCAIWNRSILAASLGAILIAGFAIVIFFRKEAVRARFRPRFLSLRQFETMVQVADAMIEPSVSSGVGPINIAIRVDHSLAKIDSPVRKDIRKCLVLIEWVLPLLRFRPIPFSDLGSFERRLAIAKITGAQGPFRVIARTLQALRSAGFYGDSEITA